MVELGTAPIAIDTVLAVLDHKRLTDVAEEAVPALHVRRVVVLVRHRLGVQVSDEVHRRVRRIALSD